MFPAIHETLGTDEERFTMSSLSPVVERCIRSGNTEKAEHVSLSGVLLPDDNIVFSSLSYVSRWLSVSQCCQSHGVVSVTNVAVTSLIIASFCFH